MGHKRPLWRMVLLARRNQDNYWGSHGHARWMRAYSLSHAPPSQHCKKYHRDSVERKMATQLLLMIPAAADDDVLLQLQIHPEPQKGE